MYADIVIIGAGVVGCGVARELSRYNTSIRVLEARFDVGEGASKANSGIVHAGYDCVPGTNKAKFNVEGAKLYPSWADELCVPFRNNGAFVIGYNDEDKKTLENLLAQGKQNGVEQLEIIDGKKALELEPHLNPAVSCALHIPTSSIVSPFEMTYALAEHAAINGVDFRLETKVHSLEKQEDGLWHIGTDKGYFTAKVVVNCAGVFSAGIHTMMSHRRDFEIHPRKGEYFLLDREEPVLFNHTIFQTPGKMGKGVLVAPTVHGNTLLGPSSTDVDDPLDVSTSSTMLDFVFDKSMLTWSEVSKRTVITTFAGMRAHEDHADFVIGAVEDAENAYETVGIESPGLSAMPAIACYLSKMIAGDMKLTENTNFKAFPKRRPYFINMSKEERLEAIAEDPNYGNMVCRCEQVTEAEIRECIRRPMGARSVDAVKRRCRAGSGRCQGGFCSPRVVEILAEELGVSMMDITKFGNNSTYFVGTLEDFAIKEAPTCK
ncbi:MAG: NAD(P)/FAD-dependent oxidoreductase [Eubacteriales bacterium]|nr:NAD(P)/FAD-dependent oxidoreductase [Eubacteriales bacterium]